MGARKAVSVKEISEMYGVSRRWIDLHAAELRPAQISFNGRPLKPKRYDIAKLENLFKTGQFQSQSSLKTEKGQSSSKKRHKEDLCL